MKKKHIRLKEIEGPNQREKIKELHFPPCQVCDFICDTDNFLPQPVVKHLKFIVEHLK